MKPRKGFTLIELLVVVAIMTVLAALLIPTLHLVRMKSRITHCENNLKNLHGFIALYQQDNIGQGGWDCFPYRLTYLARDFAQGQPEIFLCKMDGSRGMEGGKPDKAGVDQFSELDERPDLDPDTLPLSYMYEFSGAVCSWDWDNWITWPLDLTTPHLEHIDMNDDGQASWGEVKQAQMKYGDKFLNAGRSGTPANPYIGYPPNQFPVLRCFWHTENPNTEDSEILNMAYSGNVFKSGCTWEKLAK